MSRVVRRSRWSYPIYGTRPHDKGCDRRVRTRRSGVACDCGARWFCW